MSAAIAALASYGGSDSEPDSEPEAEAGSQRAAVLASRDAVLHLRAPPAAPPSLAVDAAPEVAVKVGAAPLPGVRGPAARLPPQRPRHWCLSLRVVVEQPRAGESGRKARGGRVRGRWRVVAAAWPCPALVCGGEGWERKAGVCRGAWPVDPAVALIKAH